VLNSLIDERVNGLAYHMLNDDGSLILVVTRRDGRLASKVCERRVSIRQEIYSAYSPAFGDDVFEVFREDRFAKTFLRKHISHCGANRKF